MDKNLVLDESLATASGVLLIRDGEVVEFFPRSSNGKDLGLSGDEIVLTASDEMELAEALQEFTSKTKHLSKKMENDQQEIDRLTIESAKTLNRIESTLQKLEAFVG